MAVTNSTCEPDGPAEQPPVLTGEVGASYVMIWMDASKAGVGVDAAKLDADAISAQRGDEQAPARLFAVAREGQARAFPLSRAVVGRAVLRRRPNAARRRQRR